MAKRIGIWTLVALIWSAAPSAAEELKDPTRPPTSHATETGQEAGEGLLGWRLGATHTSADGRRAILNGRVVVEGDRVGEALVVKIGPGFVRLREGEDEFTVTLLPGKIKSPAAGATRP